MGPVAVSIHLTIDPAPLPVNRSLDQCVVAINMTGTILQSEIPPVNFTAINYGGILCPVDFCDHEVSEPSTGEPFYFFTPPSVFLGTRLSFR